MHNEAVATDPEKALWQTISMFETIPALTFCILVVLVVIPCRYGDKLQYNAKKKRMMTDSKPHQNDQFPFECSNSQCLFFNTL